MMFDGTVDAHGGATATEKASLPDVPPDAAILVTGPPMTGKYELLLGLLARQADRGIVITTKHGADRVIRDYRAVAGDVPDSRIGVVDCVRRHETLEEDGTIRYAESPENLTRIGVKFTELFERFYDDEGHAAVGVHSLSHLLMHTDVSNVYKFLQVLTGHVRSVDWFHASVLDTSVLEAEQMATIQQQFDGLIETREGDDGRREFRTRGLAPDADWTPF